MGDSPFDKIDDDLRREWQEGPVTRAFVGTLLAYRKELADGVLEVIKSDRFQSSQLSSTGGELRAIDYVMLLATRERIYG